MHINTKFPGKNSDGFTLIEIIASIAILGMVIAVFLPIFPQVMNWMNSTDEQLVASNLLDQVVHDVEKNDKLIVYLDGESIPDCSGSLLLVPATKVDYKTNYSVNDEEFSMAINVCQSSEEAKLGLYRTHLQLYSNNKPDKVASDTYIYLNGDAT